MSASNGVIRIGKKGMKKFAFGDEGAPFEVDVVVAFQAWIGIDEGFRGQSSNESIRTEDMPAYHQSAVNFVRELGGMDNTSAITTAEALDFIARLREQYDELVVFFRPKLREERASPDTSGVELQFSPEETAQDFNRVLTEN